jgi:hypothetical protein
MPPPSWRGQASAEESSNWRPRIPSSRREIAQTLYFIFRRAARKSQLYPQLGKKLPSRWSPQVILLEKRRLRQWLGCVWPRRPSLLPAPRSK